MKRPALMAALVVAVSAAATAAVIAHETEESIPDSGGPHTPGDARKVKVQQTPEMKRARARNQRERLAATGPDRRGQAAAITAVTESWKAVAAALGETVDFGAWDCYAGGCTLTARHASPLSIEVILNEFTHTKAFHLWNAGKYRSPPLMQPDGTVEVMWIFSAPAAGAALMQSGANFPDDRPIAVKGR